MMTEELGEVATEVALLERVGSKAAWQKEPDVARLNRIRRENRALQTLTNLEFLSSDLDAILAYRRFAENNELLVVVNLDPHHLQSGWVQVPVEALGLDVQPGQSYQVHDLIGDARYLWSGSSNFVQLDPRSNPAHVFRIRRKTKTERDFDYFA